MRNDIKASLDDDLKPRDWRDSSSWFEGKMVKPLSNDALNYCATNGTYFVEPNAYFIEGFEDEDCDDVDVLSVGVVPNLGDLDQHTLGIIWKECFKNCQIEVVDASSVYGVDDEE